MSKAHQRNKRTRKLRQEEIDTALDLMLGNVSRSDKTSLNNWFWIRHSSEDQSLGKPTVVFEVEDEIQRLYPDINIKQAEHHARYYLLQKLE